MYELANELGGELGGVVCFKNASILLSNLSNDFCNVSIAEIMLSIIDGPIQRIDRRCRLCFVSK